MKKWIAFFLTLVLLCTLLLTSCEVPPEVTVLRAYTRTATLSKYDAQMDMKVEVHIPDLQSRATVPVRVDIQAEDAMSKHPKLALTLYSGTTVSTLRADTTLYSDGKYLYIPNKYGNRGTKVSLEALEDEYEGMDEYDDLISDLLTSLPRDILNNSTIHSEDDRVTVHTALSEEQLSELYGDIVEDVTESVGDGIELEGVSVTNAEIQVIVDDGYVQSQRLSFEISATIKQGWRSYDMTMKSTVSLSMKNPGAPVTVTFPEGYADYDLKEK